MTEDRLRLSERECKKIELEFEVVPAVNGWREDLFWNRKNEYKMCGWTSGAAGLVYSTIKVLEDAKEKKYDTILILEDDLIFKPTINSRVESALSYLENIEWELIHFEATDIIPRQWVTEGLARLNKSWSCQMYAIHHSIYDEYLTELRKVDQPIDSITSEIFHPRGKSYCISPGILITLPNFSTIRNRYTNHAVE